MPSSVSFYNSEFLKGCHPSKAYSLEIAILNVDSYNNESTIHSSAFMQFGFVKAALMRLGTI